MRTFSKWARRSTWSRVGTLAVVAMALAVPLGASAASGGASAAQSQAAFRKDFMSYLTGMHQVTVMLKASPQGRAGIAKLGVNPSSVLLARRDVSRMTPPQLAILHRAFAAVPDWQKHPALLKRALRPIVLSAKGVRRTAAVGPDCDPGPGVPDNITGVLIAEGVALALEVIHEAIPDDVTTAPFQTPAAVAWGAAAVAALAVKSFYEVEAECLAAKFEDHVETNLDVTVSSRASQVSLDAFRAEELRLKIEAALAEGLAVGSFELPAPAGHLELVRTIVVDIITKMQAAGENVGRANQHLAAADAAVTATNFKDAYNKFGRAYRAAAGGGGDDDD